MIQVGYVLVAIGYFWMDAYFDAEDLQRRFERAGRRREIRRMDRKHRQALVEAKRRRTI